MSSGKRNTLAIIALLLGASGLGLGVYSIIHFQIAIDGIIGSENIVAVWETIGGSGTTFNLTLGDIQVNNSEYFTLADGNSTIHLLQHGWYRFNIRVLWSGLSGAFVYVLEMYKNGANIGILESIGNPSTTSHRISAFIYVCSNGTDYFSIRSNSGDSHNIYTIDQDYNQVSLEYVGE
jgi:hypothetical protein